MKSKTKHNKKMKKLVAILFMSMLVLGINLNSMAANDDENKNGHENNTTMTTTIKGKVIDKETGEALTGVKVKIPGLDVETYTDFEGNFKIDQVKPGDYKIYTSFISYQNQTFKQIKLELKESNNLTLEMEKR
jgi:protocatechuate 3,4-dioxygenase beta subunit